MEPALRLWENFYVIVGSAGGALTGLQFVVIALVAGSRTKSSTAEIDAFATPTIVHFCAVLFVGAAMSAPWETLVGMAAPVASCGIFGVAYTVVVLRRARSVTGYQPVLEDWVWHTGLPFGGYGALLASGVALSRGRMGALFVIGGALLLLLFIGIHNAWDAVTYLTVTRLAGAPESKASATPPARATKRRR